MSHILDGILRQPSMAGYGVLLLVLVVLYVVLSVIYNLFLHPLRHYPGPKLWVASQIPFSLMWMSGSGHKKMLELHQRYGDVVRVTPNQLSYGYPEAWEEIMGHRKRGEDENGKDPDFWDDQDKLTVVGSSRERHRRLRRILNHGFSAQAMMAQQSIFQRYTSLLIERLKAASEGGQAVEMASWYNWTTFDIAGDLIFGEPFGCLDDLKDHPWVKLIFEHIRGIAISTAVIRFPFGKRLIKAVTPDSVRRDVQTHNEFTQAQVAKRKALGAARPDLMESIIKARERDEVSDGEVIANAHNMIVGGSETTATTLAGTTYLLATHPAVLAKLYQELRMKFKSEDEIDLISVQRLEYMLAVFDEALRIYPPVPSAIPRRAPSNGTTIGGRYVPPNTILSIWQWPMFHNPRYFKDAESFVPERWLGDPEYDSDRKKVLQPFSVGPRDCIGKNLAYAEMRLVLAKMVWNFDMKLDPRSEDWLEKNLLYFLWQKPQLYVRLMPRNTQ